MKSVVGCPRTPGEWRSRTPVATSFTASVLSAPEEVRAHADHTSPVAAARRARHDALPHRWARPLGVPAAVPAAVGAPDRADDGRGDTGRRPLALARRALGADHPRWPACAPGHLRWRWPSSVHRGAASLPAVLDARARRRRD